MCLAELDPADVVAASRELLQATTPMLEAPRA
jgi:hypothetical protein